MPEPKIFAWPDLAATAQSSRRENGPSYAAKEMRMAAFDTMGDAIDAMSEDGTKLDPNVKTALMIQAMVGLALLWISYQLASIDDEISSIRTYGVGG